MENNKEILQKIYRGGLQDHIEQDEVQVYLNNLRNDCVDYCFKDFTKKNLSDNEKLCVKNFMAKNFFLLNSNKKLSSLNSLSHL